MDSTAQTPEQARDAAARAQGIDPATGFAHDGEFPVNGRLRAEAMSAAGITTDPAGLVTDAMIADAGERLARDKAAAEEAERKANENAPSIRWSRDQLAAAAADRGLAVETDANKAAILDAIVAFDNAKEA